MFHFLRNTQYAANLGLGEFRRLAGARDVGQLPSSEVVSVQPFLGAIFALRDFLRQQAEHAETFADEIGRTELFRNALKYGDDLDTYIDVIVRELAPEAMALQNTVGEFRREVGTKSDDTTDDR